MFKKFGLIMATVLTFAACGGGGDMGSGPTAGTTTPQQNLAGGPPTTPVNIVITGNSNQAKPKGFFASLRTIFAATQGYSLTISRNYIVGSAGECSVATQSCLPPITYFGTINQGTGQASVSVNLVVGAKPLVEARAFDQAFNTSYTQSSGALSTNFPFFARPTAAVWTSTSGGIGGTELSYGSSNATTVVVGLSSIAVTMNSSAKTAALNSIETKATNAGSVIYGVPSTSLVVPTTTGVSGVTANSSASQAVAVSWSAVTPYTPPASNTTNYNVYYGVPGTDLTINLSSGFTLTGGVITALTSTTSGIVSGGTGYKVGDTVYVRESGSSKDAILSVATVTAGGVVASYGLSSGGTGGYGTANSTATNPSPTYPTQTTLDRVQADMSTSHGTGLVLDLSNAVFTLNGTAITAMAGSIMTNTVANCAAQDQAPSAVVGIASAGSGYKIGDNFKVLETGSSKDAILQVNSICTNTVNGIKVTGIVNGLVASASHAVPQGTSGYAAATGGSSTTPTQTLFNGVTGVTSVNSTLSSPASGTGISSTGTGGTVNNDGERTYALRDGIPSFYLVTAQTVDVSGNNAALESAPTAIAQVAPGAVTGAPASVTAAYGALATTLTWQAITGSTSYDVYYSTTAANIVPTATGSGLTLNATAANGVISAVTLGTNAGQGYSPYDRVYIQGGGNNAIARIDAVINGVPIVVSVPSGGSGYNSSSYSNLAVSPYNTQNFVKGIVGATTILTNSGATVTSSGGGTVNPGSVSFTGTTGTPYYFAVSANGTPGGTYGGNLATVSNPALGLSARNGDATPSALPTLTSSDTSGGIEWSVWRSGVGQYVSGCNAFPSQGLQPTCKFAVGANAATPSNSPLWQTNGYGSVSSSGIYTPPLAYPATPGNGPIPISVVARNKVFSAGSGATLTIAAGVLTTSTVTVLNPGTGYNVGDILNVATADGTCKGPQFAVLSTSGVNGGVATVSIWDQGSSAAGVPATACTGVTTATTLALPSTASATAANVATVTLTGAGAGITAASSSIPGVTAGGLGYRVGDLLEVGTATVLNPATDGIVRVTAITAGTGAITATAVVSDGTTSYLAGAALTAPASSPVAPANPLIIKTTTAAGPFTGLTAAGASTTSFGGAAATGAGSGYSVGDILQVCATNAASCTTAVSALQDGTVRVTSVNPITGAVTGIAILTAGTTSYASPAITHTVQLVGGGGDPLSLASDSSATAYSAGITTFNINEFLAGSMFGN